MKILKIAVSILATLFVAIAALLFIGWTNIPAEPDEPIHALWESCAFCHSPDGLGFVGFDAPKIAGQEAWYTARQLKAFKSGLRAYHDEDVPGKQMAVSVGPLTDDKIIAELSDFIEKLPITPNDPQTHWLTVLGPERPYDWHSELNQLESSATPNIESGQILYEACAACHGKQAEGNKDLGAPRLDNKQDWYLQRQLTYFKLGARGGKPDDEYGQVMADAMEELPDDQAIVDVVAYIMTLSKGSFDHDHHGLDILTIAGFMAEGLLKRVAAPIQSKNLVEMVLLERLPDEPRGWCVDAAGHQTRAIMAGGVHGHTCYSYEGQGEYRVAEDQGFLLKDVEQNGVFRMAAFDHCLSISSRDPGSWIALTPCDNRPEQQFEVTDTGEVKSKIAEDLCITLGSESLPGGGGSPLHQLRKLSMETCTAENSTLQRWRLRNHRDF